MQVAAALMSQQATALTATQQPPTKEGTWCVITMVMVMVMWVVRNRARILLHSCNQVSNVRALTHCPSLGVALLGGGTKWIWDFLARDTSAPHAHHVIVAAHRTDRSVLVTINVSECASDLHRCTPAAHAANPPGVHARARALLVRRACPSAAA